MQVALKKVFDNERLGLLEITVVDNFGMEFTKELPFNETLSNLIALNNITVEVRK